jgi:hypothetical protein
MWRNVNFFFSLPYPIYKKIDLNCIIDDSRQFTNIVLKKALVLYSARGEGEVERWLIEFWFRVVNIKHGRYLNSLNFTGALKLDTTYLLSILGAVPLLLLLHCSLLSCQKLPEDGTNLSSVLKDITNNRMWIVTTMISSWLVKENWWYEYVRDHHCWAESSFLNLEHEYVRERSSRAAVGLKVHSWIFT